ncbi:MAG TPA: NADP-dependent malic enzyme [Steroidobacteraceae bacterium]|nr:NADP-dependent malic enzyme [Steroidobacteraceae bacterium]
MEDDLKKAALDYHRLPVPGKISLAPTKPLVNQRDLSLAYSPGVACASMAIAENPLEAANLTARANLVAVITNGTAVLGLGNIGALAGKPVMEGKGCLFKKFAGIDVFDIEINESDPDRLVEVIAALEPTFGGINLEDIKAPECFYIEKRLRERMKIPVFHDDQHGTAIIVAAAVLNGLTVVGKDIAKVRVAVSGAGAAAIACLDLLLALGLSRENVLVADSSGVLHADRPNLDANKRRYAQQTSARTLADIVQNADIFLGLSVRDLLKPEMVRSMAERPLILALANPDPEIRPELAKQARPDCIVCTGRSDYPNQVNNSLCFPFLFRGALDVGATRVNQEMMLACVHALAELARAEQSDVVAAAYGADASLSFGPDFLIPRPFDPRLITRVAPAVAQAAMDSGVATMSIADMAAYRHRLTQFVYESASVMQPVFLAAKRKPKRVVFCEAEEPRVLQAVQVVVDEGLAHPILVGRTELIAARIEKLGLRLKLGKNCEGVNILSDPRYRDCWSEYHRLTCRQGVSRELAQEQMRSRPTLIGAMLLRREEADAMLCGAVGDYQDHLEYIRRVIGLRHGATVFAAMHLLVLPDRQLFVCDTHVNEDPSAAQIAEITLLAADQVRHFGMTPSVALLSHSSFGSSNGPSARKMREALELIVARAPNLSVEGEMRADMALSAVIRQHEFPESRLRSNANLLIMPNVDAANITFNAMRIAAGSGAGVATVGGILLGAARPAHIMTASATVRRIVDMTAFAVAEAGAQRRSTRAAAYAVPTLGRVPSVG